MPLCAARFARKFTATGAPSAAVPFWVHPVRAPGTSITVCTDEVSDVHLKCTDHSVDPRPFTHDQLLQQALTTFTSSTAPATVKMAATRHPLWFRA